MNATANPSQTLYQPHSAPIQCFFCKFTLLFVATNKSVRTFYGLNHLYTPEEFLQKSDAHLIFAMGEQFVDPARYNQRHKNKVA